MRKHAHSSNCTLFFYHDDLGDMPGLKISNESIVGFFHALAELSTVKVLYLYPHLALLLPPTHFSPILSLFAYHTFILNATPCHIPLPFKYRHTAMNVNIMFHV